MSDVTEEVTQTKVDATPPPPRRPTRRKSPARTESDVPQVVGAALAAVGVAIVLIVPFGWRNPLAIAACAYGVFVAVVATSEFALDRANRGTPPGIDLVAAEQHSAKVLDQYVPPAPPRRALQLAEDPRGDKPRKRRKFDPDDLISSGIAVVAAAAFAEIMRVVYHQRSLVGTALWWYLAFLVIFSLLVRDRSDPETALDRVVTVIVWSVGVVVAATLLWMLVFLVIKGTKALSWSFFTTDLSKVGPLNPGGGAKHAIIGSFQQVALATIVVVPISILTAVYLHEVKGRLALPVRFIVDAMAGLPSIVAGLLVFTIWVDGRGFSGVAGSAALVVLMLPTVTRTSEEILRTIPDSLREGALALGSPQWQMIRRVVVPTALAGLVTAVILGVARAIGETAPMLLTAFGTDSTNVNPTKGPQSDLPLFVFKLIREPNQRQNDRAWAGLLVLVILVLVLFVTARLVTSIGQRKLGRAR
jgi:phosphate transport system permease protein